MSSFFKSLAPQLSAYPVSRAILEELDAQMPLLLKATVEASCSPFAGRLATLELIGQRLNGIYGDPANWLRQSVRSYVVLSVEFLELQRRLEKCGHYLYSTEKEAMEHVYHNKDVYGSDYLNGLLLSQPLWPNHYLMNKVFFTEKFLPGIKKNPESLEVGVGTGFQLYQLLTAHEDVRYTGLDISDFAIDRAGKFAFGHKGRPNARFINRNVSDGIPFEDNKFDSVMMGEVLEHVENPLVVLKELARVAAPDAPIFVTTAIFAASSDHIYLFENAQEVRELISNAKLSIELEDVLPVYPSDSPESSKRPLNYCAVLKKQA
ncbi:MAG: class I SAM-dependent methyltransferase [Nitrospinae bacterium]|nr:class I SAM-dependent methyltransferase [Nitrospinota bacterium]